MDDHSGLIALRIGTEWTSVELDSEPFVTFTRRGYAAAISARRGAIPHMIYLSAVSLADPLEKWRKERGTLKGLRIRVRKAGTDQFSPYQVELEPETERTDG